MKMHKRLATMFIAVVMLFSSMGIVAQVHAQELDRGNLSKEAEVITNQDYVLERLESLDFGRDIEFFPLEQSLDRADGTYANYSDTLLHFDTVEEFEEFLRNFIEMSDELQGSVTINRPLEEINNNIYGPSMMAANRSRNDFVNWWAPFAGANQLWLWKNISYHFTYTTWPYRVQSASVTSSWTSGLDWRVSWTHRFGNATVSGQTINLSATGTWQFGISIGGVGIGTTLNDTWHRSVLVLF